MITRLLFIAVLLFPSLAFAVETLAKATYRGWSYSVMSEGTPWEKSCKLKFQVKNRESTRELSIKSDSYGCLMSGPVQLYVSSSLDDPVTTVYIESELGDDSHRSGPIIKVIYVSQTKLKKLGEYEIFDAIFHKENQVITKVTGNALYSFCTFCDYRLSSDDDKNFFVPIVMTATENGVLVKSNVDRSERKKILKSYDSRAKELSEDSEGSPANFMKDAAIGRKHLKSLLDR